MQFSMPSQLRPCTLSSGKNNYNIQHMHSQVHLLGLPGGDLLLAFDDDTRLRTPLALAMSRDGGDSWCALPRLPSHTRGLTKSSNAITYESDNCGSLVVEAVVEIIPSGDLARRITVWLYKLFTQLRGFNDACGVAPRHRHTGETLLLTQRK